MANLSSPPRNSIGDRAGPRYTLQSFTLALRVSEPGATVDSPKAAVLGRDVYSFAERGELR